MTPRATRPISRRAVLSLGLGMTASIAHAQLALPARPITLILPFGAGGSVDVIARALAASLGEELRIPVIVDNRAGASGAIGASAAARAPADGSTLYFGASSTQAVLPNVRAKLPFDPVADFTPISMVAEVENALVVTPSLPVQTVGELVAYAKSRPGQLAYGSHGQGSLTHLAGELFKMAAGVDALHVPYKIGAELDVALMNGQLHFNFATLASSIQHIRSGRLRALAMSSRQRSVFMPNLPTTAEEGLPSVVAVSWAGLYGPRHLDPSLVARFNNATRTALQSPQLKERMNTVLSKPIASSADELRDYQARDFERWAHVVKTARIQTES